MTTNSAFIEAAMHADLQEYRDALDREFFKLPLQVAVVRILDRLVAGGADRNGLFAYLRHEAGWITPRSNPSIFEVLRGSHRATSPISPPAPWQMTPVIDRRGKSSSSTKWVPLWGSENDSIWHQADEVYELVARSELNFLSRTHVRIYRKGDDFTLVTNSSEEARQKFLTRAEWVRLQQALERAEFWSMPKFQMSPVLDGYTWTISGRRGGESHVATYSNPPSPGAFYDLGQMFFELADIK